MAQTILTDQIITAEALQIAENQLVLGRTVNRQYDSSFGVPGGKIGDTLKVRLPERKLVVNGPALQVQSTNQQYVSLTVQYQQHIDLSFTSTDLTLKLDYFSDLFLKPNVSQLASTVDYTVAADTYKYIYNSVGSPGTTPSTSQVLLDAKTKLDNSAAPMTNRYVMYNPLASNSTVEGLKGLYNPQDSISKQFKQGFIGSIPTLGFEEVNMSQSVPAHTTGSRTAASNTLSLSASVTTEGTSTLAITGDSGTKTIKQGDVFTIAGVNSVNPQTRVSTGVLQQFVATADATSSGGAWSSVSVSPALYSSSHALATVNALPSSGAYVNFLGSASTSYAQNLVYHRDAIILATCDLVLPRNLEMASRQSHNGISMRLAQQYDIWNDQQPVRLDVLYGSVVARPEFACRVWGEALS